MKVYTANLTVSGAPSPASDMAGKKNTPRTFLRDYREKLPRTKYSSRQLIYTKATRIFLQHQILILYTALIRKSYCRRHWRKQVDYYERRIWQEVTIRATHNGFFTIQWVQICSPLVNFLLWVLIGFHFQQLFFKILIKIKLLRSLLQSLHLNSLPFQSEAVLELMNLHT